MGDANPFGCVLADGVTVVDHRAILQDVAGQGDETLEELLGRLWSPLGLEVQVAQRVHPNSEAEGRIVLTLARTEVDPEVQRDRVGEDVLGRHDEQGLGDHEPRAAPIDAYRRRGRERGGKARTPTWVGTRTPPPLLQGKPPRHTRTFREGSASVCSPASLPKPESRSAGEQTEALPDASVA